MDHRRFLRVRSYLQAKAVFDSGQKSLDCLVRNQSSGGMRLAISQVVLLPDEFDIVISKKGQRSRVRLIWRSADEVGVAFVGERPGSNPDEPTPVAMDSLAAIDREIAVLEHRTHELKAQRERMILAQTGSSPATAGDEPRPVEVRQQPVDVFDDATFEWLPASCAPWDRRSKPVSL